MPSTTTSIVLNKIDAARHAMTFRWIMSERPEWTWGHEGNAAGMRNHNMCGPFFGRNLTSILVWMQSYTPAYYARPYDRTNDVPC